MTAARRTVRHISRGFARYLRTETIGGMIALAATVVALVIANLPGLSDLYFRVRDFEVGPENLHLALSIGDWAKDGLLAVFFFVTGLELKRELIVGELRDRKRAMLPVFAAAGGMIVPAGLCFLLALGDPDAGRAWPIPVATDIAFALAVLAITASRLPSSVRLFLLSLAVVDDLGAIALIAARFTEDISWVAIVGALVLLAAYWYAQKRRIQTAWLYVPLAVATWALAHASGIHATIAGVALGLLTRVHRDRGEYESPAERLEHRLQPFSAGFCVPVFAFFAAGLPLDPATLSDFVRNRVAWAIMIALVVGKFIGVLGGSLAAVRTGLAKLPAGMSWLDVSALAVLAGCGFTVSLLIADLAFGPGSEAEQAKMAVLAGSVVASLVAALMLRIRVSAHDGNSKDA